MTLDEIMENYNRGQTIKAEADAEAYTPENIVRMLGGPAKAARISKILVELEAAGYFNDINFDDIVKEQEQNGVLERRNAD